MSHVGILDYGAGNLKNLSHALTFLGHKPLLINEKSDFLSVDKLIIPGVGAFKTAMEKLDKHNLTDLVKNFVSTGKPILGVCLGMQLLFEQSKEFGESKGLGLLLGSVVEIPAFGDDGKPHKIPHIGWNELIFTQPSFLNINSEVQDAVYFVHSFMAIPSNANNIIAYCKYDGIKIPAIVGQNNIFGCQFHPEKSGSVGLKILKKFLEF